MTFRVSSSKCSALNLPNYSVSNQIDCPNSTFRGQFNFVGMYKNRKPLILVLDPSIVRQVLAADFNKFADNDLSNLINEKLDPILAKNPFFFNGAAWKERRAEISPALTVSRVRNGRASPKDHFN